MKNIILCEGKTDLILISYLLNNTIHTWVSLKIHLSR
jgi:5S rRNA maturation endonuclease (ribonuclease M5)